MNRTQSLQWLAQNITSFPEMKENVSNDIFYGWRFVIGTDEVIYFANGIEKGISELEFKEFVRNI